MLINKIDIKEINEKCPYDKLFYDPFTLRVKN